jgi:hypothetical protein
MALPVLIHEKQEWFLFPSIPRYRDHLYREEIEYGLVVGHLDYMR